LVGGLAVAVYLNSLGNGFAYDDLHIIEQNEAIHSLETLPGALTAPYWPGDLGQALGLWRPLSTAIYGLEWVAWDGDPTAYHAVNVVLHAVASVLVLRLLLLLLPFWGAAAGAAIFAVHPVHVEAVANLVGRAEVLSSVFYLVACLLFCRWREDLGIARTGALCALFALAFLTKESAVTLPGVFFLLDGFFTDRAVREAGAYVRQRWTLYAGLVATAGLILAGRKAVLGSLAHPLAPFGADVLGEIPRIWTVAAAWPHYLRLLVFPADLSVDYGPAVLKIFYGWSAAGLLGVGLVLAVLVLALWAWRTPAAVPGGSPPRAVSFGIVWFVITISPTANVAFLSGVLLAERTLYLPSVGFAVCAGWIVSSIHVERPRLAATLLVLAVGLGSARTITRNPVWKDNLTVFNSLLQDHPESGRAQWALGDVLFTRGQVSEALRAYRIAIGIAGAHYSLTMEIAEKLIEVEQLDAAARILELAWAEHPEFAAAPSRLTTTYATLERWPEAERAIRASLTFKPRDVVTLHLLAVTLGRQGRWAEAADARRATLEVGERDRWQQWVWLAEEEANAGRPDRARAALDSARVRVDVPSVQQQLDSLESALEAR
jgi:tetratricopeptide (TPR) repeat protein